MLHFQWQNIWENHRNTHRIFNFHYNRGIGVDITEHLTMEVSRPQFWAINVDDMFKIIKRNLPKQIESNFSDIHFIMKEEGLRELPFLNVLVCHRLMNDWQRTKQISTIYTPAWQRQSSDTQNRPHQVVVQSYRFVLQHPNNQRRGAVTSVEETDIQQALHIAIPDLNIQSPPQDPHTSDT